MKIFKRILSIFLCLSLLTLPVESKEQKYAALTFDDGPSGRFTRRLLEGLQQRKIKATFLLCGYRLRDYGREAEMIAGAGHEIGVHGYSHENMSKMDPAAIQKELRNTIALLPAGEKPVFFRPPGGAVSESVREKAREVGLSLLLWSVDPQDWKIKNGVEIAENVIRQTRDGDVILLHDMSDSSVDAALEIIDRLSEKGFRFVTVSELASLRGISPKPGETYYRFP